MVDREIGEGDELAQTEQTEGEGEERHPDDPGCGGDRSDESECRVACVAGGCSAWSEPTRRAPSKEGEEENGDEP
jgi:hypothetical protein